MNKGVVTSSTVHTEPWHLLDIAVRDFYQKKENKTKKKTNKKKNLFMELKKKKSKERFLRIYPFALL